MRVRRRRTVVVLDRGMVVLTVSACLLVAVLPEPSRPPLVAAGLAVAAALTAAATAWRTAGTVTLTLTTATVLLASVLDASDLRPAQLVLTAALLVAVAAALDRSEDGGRAGSVTVLRAPAARPVGRSALAAGAAAVVAYTAARTVVPSVGLVLAGLAAAAAALVLATRAHGR